MAFKFSELSDDEIRRIVEAYLRFMETMESVAKRYNTTPDMISKVLYKAVAENIVDDITADAVATKAMKFTKNVVLTRRRWTEALAKRKKGTIKEQLEEKRVELRAAKKTIENLQANIQAVNFQLENYDEYFVDEVDAPTEQSLQDQIARLNSEIAAYQRDVMVIKNEIEELEKKLK